MRNLIYTVFSLLTTINLYSQSIVNIENQNGEIVAGTYYKDVNNVLDSYIGTFQFQNGEMQVEIILQKRQMENINNVYFEDLIIGEYRYIKNGQEISNSLSNLNFPQSNPYEYSITGNTILIGNIRGCDDCLSNEKRLELGLSDDANDRIGSIIIRKISQGNQELFEFSIMWSMRIYNPVLSSSTKIGLPNGEFLFRKL